MRIRHGAYLPEQERSRIISDIFRPETKQQSAASLPGRYLVQLKTQGLIIREQTVGESDRLVTVLTKDEGVIRAFARRAKNLKDAKNSATGLLCYSRLNIYKGRDKYIINDAFPIEVFFGLREDILRLALAQYFCGLCSELIPDGVESGDYLRLVLNALHFLSNGTRSPELLKPIVELRMLSLAGYMPDLICCAECGAYEADRMYFKINRGTIYCQDCFKNNGDPCVSLSRAAMTAMRHIIYSDFEKIFSFSVSAGAERELSTAVEEYTVHILQKRLKTLDFYQSLRAQPGVTLSKEAESRAPEGNEQKENEDG